MGEDEIARIVGNMAIVRVGENTDGGAVMGRLGPFEDTVICGDVIEVLSQFPDACVDAIVTDPPYGLEFMGKEWDKFQSDGSWNRRGQAWHEKFGNSAYGRLLDKAPINWAKAGHAYQSWTTSWATEAYRILKPGAYMLVMGGTRTHHRSGVGLEDAGFQILDEVVWIHSQGFPKNTSIAKFIDKRAGKKKIKEIRTDGTSPTGFEPARGWHQHSMQREYEVWEPATPEAQYWQGYGTALKPAHEPIWLCKKPNEGSYVDNVLKHGCGAMNIDGSRVEYRQAEGPETVTRKPSPLKQEAISYVRQDEPLYGGTGHPSGRWPANVIVDCYPEEFIGRVVIEGEGNIAWQAGQDMTKQEWQGHKERRGGWNPETGYAKGETLKGNGLLGPYTRFFVVPKPSKAEKTCNGRVENKHVTVKPVRLGRWLIKLITPHQHPVVLVDPFCGSGSFLVAAQELNYEEGYQIDYYGIDKDKDSIETAMARLKAGERLL